jgi:hypothetical protein
MSERKLFSIFDSIKENFSGYTPLIGAVGIALACAVFSIHALWDGVEHRIDHLVSDTPLEKAIREGYIGFNVPGEMKQGEEQRITIRIATDSPDKLGKDLAGEPAFKRDSLTVAPYMTVKLKAKDSEAFEIVSQSPEDQFVGSDTFTEWRFDVKPLKSGLQELDLMVGVRIKDAGSQEIRFEPSYDRKLNVKVDAVWVITRFVSKNWKWIIGTLLLPIVGYLIKRKLDASNAQPQPNKKEEATIEVPEVEETDEEEESEAEVKDPKAKKESDDDGLE